MTSRRARVLLTLATSAVLVAPVVSSSYAAERDRLYALLTPADKATADRIVKETP